MRFRCYNRNCGLAPNYFEFEGDAPLCPKCFGTDANDVVLQLTDVHFLAMGHGPLKGRFGAHHVACEPDREHLAHHTADEYAASDWPAAVTCPRCRETKEYQEFVRALFPSLWASMQGQKAPKRIVDLGDCGCK